MSGKQELIMNLFIGHPKLVQSLDSVFTCMEMYTIIVTRFMWDSNIDYWGHLADADGPKIDV